MTTKIFDLFTRHEFEQQIADKMVAVKLHPTENLAIANYTQQATFTPAKWNHVTDVCRGLIYRPDTLDIVARGFKKFWNINDERHPETMMANLPSRSPILTEKLDGSLGIAYRTAAGKWAVATRGSFVSDQAKWATKQIQQYDLPVIEGCTYLFEIIYAENRIVVKYDYSDLVLLSIIYNDTAPEMPMDAVKHIAIQVGVRVVRQIEADVEAVLKQDTQYEEGYVATWHSREGKAPLKVKIKYATYCRLHRLFTQTTPWRVWEMLKLEKLHDLQLVDVPNGFKGWLYSQVERFCKQFGTIYDEALRLMESSGFLVGQGKTLSKEQRKEFASYTLGLSKPYTQALFAMLDGKNPSSIIWDSFEPRGDEKPFLIDE